MTDLKWRFLLNGSLNSFKRSLDILILRRTITVVISFSILKPLSCKNAFLFLLNIWRPCLNWISFGKLWINCCRLKIQRRYSLNSTILIIVRWLKVWCRVEIIHDSIADSHLGISWFTRPDIWLLRLSKDYRWLSVVRVLIKIILLAI